MEMPEGRRRALVAFCSVLIGWVLGFGSLYWSLSHSSGAAHQRSSGIFMEAMGTFVLLCDFVAIVLGIQAMQRGPERWKHARTYGIIAVTLAVIGIFGALALMLLGSLMKDCAGCDASGCAKQLDGIGHAVAQ